MDSLKDKTPTTVADFKLEELDGEMLLYSPASTRSIYLNPSASVIWQLCNGEATIGEITEALSERFPDAAADMQKDVAETIQTFLDNDAITLS